MIYSGAALLCAGIAAVHDLKDRRIPNRLTGPAILAGLVLHLFLGGFSQMAWSLLAGLIAGGIFLLFYVAGGMGAGDVKLMTAIGCLSGISSIRTVLLATVIIGGIFALALAAYRGKTQQTLANVATLLEHHQTHGVQAHPELNVANQSALRLPYALPIALGCLWAFCSYCVPSLGGSL
jgi:prepilin peptidase CpaA